MIQLFPSMRCTETMRARDDADRAMQVHSQSTVHIQHSVAFVHSTI